MTHYSSQRHAALITASLVSSRDIPTCLPTPDPPVDSQKEKAIPTRSPTPNPLVNSPKCKQASAPPITTIFDDDNPLTEEEEPETIQPAKHT
ncbi:hypothetical protein BDR03DRAFT_1010167 [Suillus americanus]|nr:hypothetical protein BDR03DRAFT_1010167 [Suillus americanus]